MDLLIVGSTAPSHVYPDRLEPQPGDARPLVHAAFETAYTDNLPIYHTCVETLAAEYRLVIATGKVDPGELGRLH